MAFLQLIETIAVVKFQHVCDTHNGDIDAIYKHLLRDGLDRESLGFWVWEIETGKELYSPGFRNCLGFEGEHDFPSVADSWQKAITEDSLSEALENFELHIKTKGAHKYNQIVTYNKKHGGTVTLDCHGAVTVWDGDKPILMIGAHLEP